MNKKQVLAGQGLFIPILNKTNEMAHSIEELNAAEWRIVGRRPIEAKVDWAYVSKIKQQVQALSRLRDTGVVLFTQRRDGEYWTLLAKVARVYVHDWPVLLVRELTKLSIAEERARRALEKVQALVPT